MEAFLLVSLSLIPVLMIAIGLIWRTRPPTNINWTYGYRTEWSMKSNDTWDFAHKYFATLSLRIGIPLLIATAALWTRGRNQGVPALTRLTVAILILQLVCLVLPLWPVEVALRRRFDASGKYRTN